MTLLQHKLKILFYLIHLFLIELYYADKSHIYRYGYVPYGWQFKDENVYIPSKKTARLNILTLLPKEISIKAL